MARVPQVAARHHPGGFAPGRNILPSAQQVAYAAVLRDHRVQDIDSQPRAQEEELHVGTLPVIYRFTGYAFSQPLLTGGRSHMATFTQYTIANAPEASKPLLEQVDKALGFIPNLYATFAESPALLEGALALDAGLDQGALSGVERQLVKIAVSTENGCTYC